MSFSRGHRSVSPLRVPADPGPGKTFELLVRAGLPTAPVSVHGQRGESPRQACALRGVTEHKGVPARWGPKQWEVRDRSAAKANLIWPCGRGEPAREWRSLDPGE